MPLCWLAGNTHLLGQMGYNWSSRSMGKAIDALESTLVDIECNGELYLNKDYMRKIFDITYTDSNGNSAPLKTLQDAMKYMFETKQSQQLVGSSVPPYKIIHNELFHPTREENFATNQICKRVSSRSCRLHAAGSLGPQKSHIRLLE